MGCKGEVRRLIATCKRVLTSDSGGLETECIKFATVHQMFVWVVFVAFRSLNCMRKSDRLPWSESHIMRLSSRDFFAAFLPSLPSNHRHTQTSADISANKIAVVVGTLLLKDRRWTISFAFMWQWCWPADRGNNNSAASLLPASQFWVCLKWCATAAKC